LHTLLLTPERLLGKTAIVVARRSSLLASLGRPLLVTTEAVLGAHTCTSAQITVCHVILTFVVRPVLLLASVSGWLVSRVLARPLGDQARASVSNLLEASLTTALVTVLTAAILIVSGRPVVGRSRLTSLKRMSGVPSAFMWSGLECPGSEDILFLFDWFDCYG
jgi:hypothetical protein